MVQRDLRSPRDCSGTTRVSQGNEDIHSGVPTDLPHFLHQGMDTLELCSYYLNAVLIHMRGTATGKIALHHSIWGQRGCQDTT